MQLTRDKDGTWSPTVEGHEQSRVNASHPAYLEALPRYMTALDPAFTRARERCESEFIISLLRVRDTQDAGWDPYETTLRSIPALIKVFGQIDDFEVKRHLQLWIYGHILEASEPYELLANLIDVANGGIFSKDRFPPKRSGQPQSPGEKIDKMKKSAAAAGMSSVVTPLQEAWNRDFRNSIFHADYILYGDEVRTVRPLRTCTCDEVMTLTNRAIAYHEALSKLHQVQIASYMEPVPLNFHPELSKDPEERVVVIVREGYGAVGLKGAWTAEQIAAGKDPYLIGRFTMEEINLLENNPTLALLPPAQMPQPNSG